MVSTVTQGYNRKCKDSLGGISKLWLFPYVKYSRSQIIIDGNILETFPNTTIYRFNFVSNPSPTENQAEDDGGKYYDLGISFDLQGLNGSANIEKLLYKDYRFIIQDRNGLFRIFGLYNGVECSSLTSNTGSSKTDLNGFNLSFEGKEEKGSFFINNLEEAGFFDADFNYRITQDGQFRITENNNFRIIQ